MAEGTDKKRRERKPKGYSEIFIGGKAFMNYVTGVVMQFNGGAVDVSIKARGKYISRAVDVAEVVKNRFFQGVEIKEVKIGSEEFTGDNNRQIRVSTIDIVLTK